MVFPTSILTSMGSPNGLMAAEAAAAADPVASEAFLRKFMCVFHVAGVHQLQESPVHPDRW